MDKVNQLIQLLSKATSDARLTSTHISMYCVLCYIWLVNDTKPFFNISRSKIMAASKIKSKSTYHRILADLKRSGYILYKASYHPIHGSSVSLL